MHSLLKKSRGYLVLALLLITGASSRAQTTVAFRSSLDGSQNQLVQNAEVTVQDTAFFDPAYQSMLVTPYPVKNIITFRLNEYSNVYLPVKFSATAHVRITYTLPDLSTAYIDKDLVIGYDTTGNYTARSSYVFNNSHRVTVKLLDLTSDAGNGVLPAMMIDNEIQAQPIYNLSCTNNAIQSISAAVTPNADSTDEITVSWTAQKGADEYDLEWAYIDSTALARYGNPLNRQLIFADNATRVSVKNNTYAIPLLYDNGGILYFRVRAVQQKTNGQRFETAWSSDFTNGMGSYSFCGHQRSLNWQSTVSYAEEGKRKAVVQYYDGSLRSRQTVTKDNTTNTTLVGESFYDYQGRPVISVLPAPTLSSVIKYSRSLNVAADNTEYDKDNYDHIDNPIDFLTASAEPMSDESGTNNYYSGKNPQKTEGFNKFIPDAGGYAFTETAYTQDNTGRISRQSGVGPTYKLSSNHETKYYYSTASQKELNMLFGTEAGDETHYFKNMVRDANGQYAVSYLDMHGRTIATALAGTPDSASMANLPSNVPFTVYDTLSGPGKNIVKDLVMESHKSQVVPVEGNYEFKYELMPPVLHKDGCTAPVCYNALYDLEITITDDSYNHTFGGQPYRETVSIPGTFTADCGTPPQPITKTFIKFLPKGSYEITKRLTISRKGLEYYRDSVFASANLCKTLDDFIQEQRTLLLSTECTPTCQSCMDSLGTWDVFRNNYMKRAGITKDTAAYRGEAWAAFQSASVACNALCNKESGTDDLRRALLLDMTPPSGQYADIADAQNEYSIFHTTNTDPVPIYRHSDVLYLDEEGNPDMVYDQVSNTYVKPQDLSPEKFAAAFKESWAAPLLRFHPECCKFLEYEKYDASNKWDRDFEATDSYAAAKAKGYLNPTGGTGGDFSAFPSVPANQDPFAADAGRKSDLERWMTNYKRINYSWMRIDFYSMWSAAAILVKCDEGNEGCVATYKSSSEAFNESKLCSGDLDMIWRSFRQLYLQKKHDLIYDRIKNATCQGLPTSTPEKLVQMGKQPNFNDASSTLNQNGLGYLNNMTTVDQGKNKGEEELNKAFDANCRAYAQFWIQQLAPCKYPQADLNVIIEKLVNVCKAGSDRDHTTGSSTVKPGSTYTYHSFQEVLDEYNAAHNITDPLSCNSQLITSPKPYDRQPAYGSQTTYTPPGDCECTKLNALHAEFLAKRRSADSNFAMYLLRTRGVKILESNLQKLLNACNNNSNSSCTYLPEPLHIPALIQCYTAPACVTCQVVDSLYTLYTNKYPGYIPTKAEADTIQQKKNRLFANYMNNKLGFGKEAWEYLAFRDSCQHAGPAQDSIICVPSARQLIKLYSGGGTDVMSDIIRTSDNGYLMAGSTTVGGNPTFSRAASSSFVSNGKDGYLIKTDSKGVLQWAKTYGAERDEDFVRLKATGDGGYIALGTSTSKNYPSSVFVVKTDAGGNVTWSRSIGFGSGYGERGFDIVQMDNGGYAFTGAYNYGPSSPDWLVGTLTPEGNLNWVKRMGTPNADPTAYLTTNGDTLVLSASIAGRSIYDGTLVMINGNTGAFIKGYQYDLEIDNGSQRSNWFGNIRKTNAGYKISVLDTKDYGGDEGTGIILDLGKQGEVLSAKALPRPPQNISWLPLTLTADGGALATQIMLDTPRNVYLHKVAANNTLTWSSQITIPGNEQLGGLLQNTDGSFAAVGIHDNTAMLILPTAEGKTGCQDSAMNLSYTDVSYWTNTYSPLRDQYLSPGDINMSITAQAYFPVESMLSCTGFDSCYRVSNLPLLCGNAEEVFTGVPLDTINNCSDNEFFAISTGTNRYNAYRDSIRNDFEQQYINTCLQAAELEQFTVKYSTSEYHYTLYYYDQAGNLVKTIPPAGVVVDRSDDWYNRVQNARKKNEQLAPAHSMPTHYRYNTLNQVIAQKTPDAGISHFWYDRLGRLAISQNAKQVLLHNYSYTLYDELGRITEVGEITSNTAMTDATSRNADNLQQWLNNAAGTKTQITRTVYDLPHSPFENLEWNAANLRNRVSWTAFYNTAAGLSTADGRVSGTFYSYDILGNVKELLQDYHISEDACNRFKKIVYDYDLISGKVNKVSYQPGQTDAFYHRYGYDAENRLTNVETSSNGIYWENDAFYQYYKHGPLARMVLGQQQVQGVDYAYTLQGWLKGVNSTALTAEHDMGHDGATGGITARDAFGFGLHYYGERDYHPINNTVHPVADIESAGNAFKPLFNGNIGAISLNLPKVGEPLLYTYGYDVLNRLVTMNTARNLNATTNAWSPVALPDFGEQISYDANGNILTYNRNGNTTWANKPQVMDQLTYNYIAGTNKLDAISEPSANNGNYDNDLDGQALHNYDYDAIGNLTKDVAAGINQDGIEWTVYGKIKKITKHNPDNSTTEISYAYDPSGNRISKKITGGAETRYIRDASGNVMSIYVSDPAVQNGKVKQTEISLYGSSRLGITNPIDNFTCDIPPAGDNLGTDIGQGTIINFARGSKFFELSNHLGNVLATAMDSKTAVSVNGSVIDHYEAHLASAQDYYPFGMLEPGRSWNAGNYRYGFNGKENDNEVKGEGNSLDFGARVYDPRVGIWLSVDPLQAKYANITPYHFAAGNPVNFIDVDGRDIIRFTKTTTVFPRIQISDGFYIGGSATTSTTVSTIKAPGKDVFFYDVVQKSLDVHGGVSTVHSKSTQFYPNDPNSATGITKSASNNIPFTQTNDLDFISLAKLAPDKLVDDLIKKDPNTYGTLNLVRAGLKIEEHVKTAVGTALLAEGTLSLLGSATESETFYRTISREAYESYKTTGKMPAGSETFISPTEAFSQDYEGVLLKFNLKPGTLSELERIGVRNTGQLIDDVYGNLPKVNKGWKATNAFFKQETNAAGLQQINIGLGNGKALDIFNKNIQSSQVIKP